ncbi:hypothetical protein Dimus_000549, partial [Dionaea muscipula]
RLVVSSWWTLSGWGRACSNGLSSSSSVSTTQRDGDDLGWRGDRRWWQRNWWWTPPKMEWAEAGGSVMDWRCGGSPRRWVKQQRWLMAMVMMEVGVVAGGPWLERVMSSCWPGVIGDDG